jgi:predicted O-linked N-acetylglucosamine transferase (SPINDLY family)
MPPSINAVLNQALQDFNRGNLEEAKKKLSYILNIQPRNIAALEILGALFFRQGYPQQAIKPLQKITKIKPGYPEAWHNLGIALLALKQYEQALAVYDRAIALKPEYAEAWSNRGNALAGLEQYEEALTSFDNTIAHRPNYSEAWSNRGNVLRELRQYEEALASYDKAINLTPDYADAWSNRGVTLIRLKQFEEALASYDKVISLKPNYAEAWANRGVALKQLKRFEEALTSYDKAISLKPDYAEAWSFSGIALQELKQYEQSLACFDKAISYKPNYATAWFCRGEMLKEPKRYEEALISYEKVIDIDPNYEFCLGQKLHAQMHMCIWKDLEPQLIKLSERVSNGIPASTPFSILALLDEPKTLQRAADIYVQAKFPTQVSSAAFDKKNQTERTRIGYYSADFHNHATSYLMAELFEVHDRSRFEIFGFSFGPNKQDEMRERVAAGVDHFHEVSNKSDREIAELSRTLGIDIAIDLKGFTQDSRTGIFAERCAPIQVNYLGYPGTMAAPYIDYIIADPVLIPPETQDYYSEKVVYLPDCYQINDGKRRISQNEFTREEFGLPGDQFVFCCFNNNYKILPETFDSWMRILKSVEGSVLWLIQANDWSTTNLRKEAAARGIDESRLVFAKRMELEGHLARHRLADLFLDTLPYNAHTTASDALWAGLPVLTQIGQSFAARVSASLLTAIGLPELITRDVEQYESLAIELAQNPSKLSSIRQKLEANKTTSPLFNASVFAKNIENAYSQIMERYTAGQEPEHIYVESTLEAKQPASTSPQQ